MDAEIISSLSATLSLIAGLATALFWLAGLEYRLRICKSSQKDLRDALTKQIDSNETAHNTLSREFAHKVDELQESFSGSEKVWLSIDKSQSVIQADLKHTLEMFDRVEREHGKQVDEIFERLREIELRSTK